MVSTAIKHYDTPLKSQDRNPHSNSAYSAIIQDTQNARLTINFLFSYHFTYNA